MIDQQIENRESIIEQTRKEDERSDLKQHADKMLRDFEKFNENSSSRAIWELVQNACDLTTNCEIEIDYRGDKLSFTHNGKPFNTKSLISLIKQVSGKYGDQQDIPEVGKYGTGFLTTHSFGRTFIIDSILDAGEYHIPINNFKIDRSPRTWELLSDNISEQKKKVYDLLKDESSVRFNGQKTTFTFLPETSKEFEYIQKSQKDLDGYIPLVFTVNDRLKRINIITEDAQVEYVFKEKNPVANDKGINLYQTIIERDSDPIHVYSIVEDEEEIEIILPINKNKKVYSFPPKITRLFLYYPLIGSENFGINFIINCKKFLPTEPRDGVHLNSDKDQVKDQEELNRKIISKCTDLIFKFLKSNVIDVPNPLLYANIAFKTDSDNQLLNEYFKELQDNWNARLELLPFVRTSEGYKTIQEVDYFSEDFLVDDASLLDCFYELISKFYNIIPLKEEVIMWSNNAVDWNNDSIKFITHSDLIDHISQCSLDDFNPKTLKRYYQHLIDEGLVNMFNDYRLLPNLDGTFSKQGHFLISENLNLQIVDLGRALIPEKVCQLINNDFTFNFTFPVFNQRNFSDEVKNELDKRDFSSSIFFSEHFSTENYHNDLIDEKEKIDSGFFSALFNFCKLAYNKDANNKPSQLIKYIAKYYNLEEELILLPIDDEKDRVELRSIRKILFEIFFNLFSLHNNEWVRENISFIYNIHTTYDDSNKDIFKVSSIYPNQLYELCLPESLKRDNGVNEEIKKIYKEIIGHDINEKLILSDFNLFIPEEDAINNRYLTAIIEDKIFNIDVFNIEDHPHAQTILKIIPKLNEREYQGLFPQLNERKASIMISVVTNEDKKEDIFAIVTLEDEKLKSIGRLIASPNFDLILDQAIDLVEDENQQKANFQFKHQIGTHIEKKLKNHLQDIFNPDDIKCEVIGEQDGQDIILKIKDDVRYYIEVKSRWDKKTSIRMSKNQTIRSNEKKEIYALCSVDMTDYHGEDRYEINDISKVFSNIRFVTDIGTHVEHLVDVLRQTNNAEQVHLDGDYRTLVPQDVVNDFGIPMNEFETFLIDLLK